MLRGVIFDVGGVLVRTQDRLGRQKWAGRLGLEPQVFEDFIFSGESGRLAQLGRKTYEAHWQWLQEHFQLSAADGAEMHRDFFAGDALNEPLLAQIKRLRQAGYRTGLLSNGGDNVRRLLTDVYPILDYFEAAVISAEVGVMKPDPQIYHLAADSLGLRPEEALFVDDFIENVIGAREIGMLAIHFTDPLQAQRHLAAMTGVE